MLFFKVLLLESFKNGAWNFAKGKLDDESDDPAITAHKEVELVQQNMFVDK